MVRLYAGGMAEQCGMNGFCSRQFVVEGNGNIYPCDFYSNDEWLLGNINNTDFRAVFQLQLAIKFLKESCEIDGKCENVSFCAYAVEVVANAKNKVLTIALLIRIFMKNALRYLRALCKIKRK